MALTDISTDHHPDTRAFRAAQYVRMSTEHQQYSTLNQADKIREYADKRGIEIVRTYADDGKSGLSIGGRASLQKLIADVESGNTDFNLILVYDVSRWGRFQDADESAYYEYICKRQGISVAYVAEQFENDGSPVSTIVKGVKRAMAGEYSRELSAKVFAGQCRLIELGFRQGGPAGFGLRRVLIDQSGAIKATLKPGEHKSLQTDRVILVPGPAQEVATVNQIYRWLVDDDLPLSEIAQRLNDIPIPTDLDRPWTYSTVRQVLTNEKYIGNNVYNRHSFKLKKKHVDNPPEMWIRKEGAFEGIVPLDTFLAAQEVLTERSKRLTDEELLNHLKALYAECGRLSGFIIDQVANGPSASLYTSRFGIVFLLDQGEERLIEGVQRGAIPLTTALEIARAKDDDESLGEMLQEAYENGQLNRRQIIETKRLVEKRQAYGPGSPDPAQIKPPTSSYSLVRTYQREVERQRKMVLKAEHAHQRLLLVVQGLKKLFSDEHFVNLLRAEGLDTLPKYLAERIDNLNGAAA